MTKKQLFEMLKNVPDGTVVLVYTEVDFEVGYNLPVTDYRDNADGTITLYSGDTD